MKRSILITSPNQSVYCKIFKIGELNKAAFGCKFYFKSCIDDFIYYKEKTYMHELINNDVQMDRNSDNNLKAHIPSLDQLGLKFLQWSIEGNMVYFLEYSRSAQSVNYFSVLVDFAKKIEYRVNEDDNKFKIMKDLEITNYQFNEAKVVNTLERSGYFPKEISSSRLPLWIRIFQ